MPRPLAVRRHSEIVRQLRALGSVSVSELADRFGVSHETVRRDLKQLATSGHLEIVHGGATAPGSGEPATPSDNSETKAAIGRTAAALVQPGHTVLLDWCSTTGARQPCFHARWRNQG
jgi:DeoR/GlpR family transcriptional regulator of sugar metabolism